MKGINIKIFHNIVVLLVIYITSAMCSSDFNLTTDKVDIIMSDIKDILPVFTTDNNLYDFDAAVADYELAAQNEDINLNVIQLIKKYGYVPEEHVITTSDGYVVKIHRIVGKGPPVLLTHGLLGSSYYFISTGKSHALAFVLANAGYDVWLANHRGNEFGRQHISLSPSTAKFWDFSWHEIAVIDLAQTIDYILKVTNKTKLNYIGHSHGTTLIAVLLSILPEYNDKIALSIHLAPICWTTNILGVNKLVSPLISLLTFLTSITKHFEIPGRNPLIDAIYSYSCGTTQIAKIFCGSLLFLLSPFNYSQLDASLLPSFYAHLPVGGSSKQLVHYAQLIQSEKFRQYDYGTAENILRYDSIEPPDYPVEKITAPTVLCRAPVDLVASETNVKILAEKLPNLVEIFNVPDEFFAHMDFVLAKDVVSLVYNKLLSYLSDYNN